MDSKDEQINHKFVKQIIVYGLRMPRNMKIGLFYRPNFSKEIASWNYLLTKQAIIFVFIMQYIAFNNKMKPLSELKLNKCSIVGASQKQMEKQKGKTKRPALELLNLLNNKLAEQNVVAQYKKDMQVLKQENQHLKIVNDDLTRELEVQKKLRKVWNKEEVIVYEDIQTVRKELQEIKSRYLHYK